MTDVKRRLALWRDAKRSKRTERTMARATDPRRAAAEARNHTQDDLVKRGPSGESF